MYLLWYDFHRISNLSRFSKKLSNLYVISWISCKLLKIRKDIIKVVCYTVIEINFSGENTLNDWRNFNVISIIFQLKGNLKQRNAWKRNERRFVNETFHILWVLETLLTSAEFHLNFFYAQPSAASLSSTSALFYC